MAVNDNNEFAAGTRRLLILQIAFGGFAAAGSFLKFGVWGAQSAIYGAVVSIMLTLLLVWGVRRAANAAAENKKKSAAFLYIGAAQRFLLALVLFAFGLASLKLDPLPVIIGFVASQAAYMFQMRKQRTATKTANSKA